MSKKLTTSPHVLDLTSKQTLFELAIEPQELLSHEGAKLIADLKERASDAQYTYIIFRDPMRPGIVWTAKLTQEENKLVIPVRGRLDLCRKIASRVFPKFLEHIEESVHRDSSEEIILSQIPPIVQGVSGMELATALEYLVYVYPQMVRAWAALIFTYHEILGLKDGAESAQAECTTQCTDAPVVMHLMAEHLAET